MNENSSLFSLIKSLNKNEKRYFRLFSSMQSGNKNYLDLFNSMEKEKSYHESRFREKYRNEKFILQLAYNKNYLYRLIIKCLAVYNTESSAESKIQLMITECKILFNKAMYREYFNAIDKAKKYSLKYERFGYFLQILDMEKVIIRKEELQTDKSVSLYKEAIAATEKIRNMFDFSLLSSRSLYNYREYGTARGKKQENEINDILTNPLISDINNALSSRAKESFYRIHEIINNTRADYQKAIESLEKRKDIVENDPAPFEDYIIDTKSEILHSIMNTYLNMNMFNEAEKYLKLYYATLTEQRADIIDYEIFSTFVRFQVYLKKGEVKRASRLIPLLEKILVDYKNKMLIDLELNIHFTIIKCRILEKNFSQALKSANILLAHPLLGKRADYETYTRILNLIIHFELGNYSLLKYLMISTYRYLYKHKKKFRLETVVLQFIRKIPDVKTDEGLRYSFTRFKKKLEKLKKDEYEKNAFEYFDFLEWINGKINSKKVKSTSEN
jgi:hypothetical protein